jgi:hypothetical protein
MIDRSQSISIIDVRPFFSIPSQIVIVFIDTTDPRYTHHCFPLPDLHHSTRSEIVDVFSDPPPIVYVSQQIRSLVIPTHKYRKYRCSELSVEVLLELAHLLVFWWAFECIQVFFDPQTLEITRTYNEIHFLTGGFLPLIQFLI